MPIIRHLQKQGKFAYLLLAAGLAFSALISTWCITTTQAAKENLPGLATEPQFKGENGAKNEQIKAALDSLPLSFEPFAETPTGPSGFLARGGGYKLFLTQTETILAFDGSRARKRLSTRKQVATSPSSPTGILRLQMVGANPNSVLSGEAELPGRVNYFVGQDPARWRSDVPTYATIRRKDVYPNIDMVYYGRQRQLEYDFVVKPGANPQSIRLQFIGAKSVRLDSNGDLLLQLPSGQLRQHRPVIYQEIDGQRRAINGRYEIFPGRQAGIIVSSYDPTKDLVIDPVLSYSTYLGGFNFDAGYAVAADTQGNAYFTGIVSSTNFPVSNGRIIRSFLSGCYDAFVLKMNPAGTSLIYSTFLGGTDSCVDEIGTGIAVDANGSVYLTGYTSATDFPTVGAVQSTSAGGSDGFVSKISPSGSALQYSTYLGGSLNERSNGLALDSAGSVYIVGTTMSANFPTTAGAYQTANGSIFVAKFNPSGQSLAYSTVLGNNSIGPEGNGIAVDANGQACITGASTSAGFPTTPGAFQTVATNFDAFVTKFNATGTGLVFSTFLGGNRGEVGYAVALDTAANVYVTGETNSTNFPTLNAVQPNFGGGSGDSDGFVTKLNSSGSALVFSTYLGGNTLDRGLAIAVDLAGNSYVTGVALSPDFPLFNPIQATYGGNGSANGDMFVSYFRPNGALRFSTFLGGSNGEGGRGIALVSQHQVIVGGFSFSGNFPLLNPIQANNNGISDAILLRLNSSSFQFSAPSYTVNEGSGSAQIGVQRTGFLDGPATLEYFTTDGTASQARDYTAASGTLNFATGELGKSFTVLLTDNAYLDSDRTIILNLSQPSGGVLLDTPRVELVINDNDIAPPTTNPSDGAGYFVRQHYADFLNRNPDAGGLDYWTGVIAGNPLNNPPPCPANDARCLLSRRIGVSAAFFIELEFQETGGFVYRFYKATYGLRPVYPQFTRDRARIIGGSDLEANKMFFAEQWVQRPEFLQKYPASLSGPQFIDALLQTVLLGSNVNLSGIRVSLLNDFNTNMSRARIVRLVADNQTFAQTEFNPSFVLTQYFGYLRREPDAAGYNFWLNVLNSQPNNFRGMVCAFITSVEYQVRFSPLHTYGNADCLPGI